MNWKLLSSDYVMKESWCTIRKDKCETPSGTIIDPYYVYEFPTWVTALALTEDNKAVMIRQYRHGIQQTIIEIPGGCVDDTDKNLEEAISRELFEETGYRFRGYQYLGKISANPSTNNNWMHMFLATGGVKEGDQQLDHNEEIDVELVDIAELERMVDENMILQSMHLSTIIYALRKLRQP